MDAAKTYFEQTNTLLEKVLERQSEDALALPSLHFLVGRRHPCRAELCDFAEFRQTFPNETTYESFQ